MLDFSLTLCICSSKLLWNCLSIGLFQFDVVAPNFGLHVEIKLSFIARRTILCCSIEWKSSSLATNKIDFQLYIISSKIQCVHNMNIVLMQSHWCNGELWMYILFWLCEMANGIWFLWGLLQWRLRLIAQLVDRYLNQSHFTA